jgi:hypothetical protein
MILGVDHPLLFMAVDEMAAKAVVRLNQDIHAITLGDDRFCLRQGTFSAFRNTNTSPFTAVSHQQASTRKK